MGESEYDGEDDLGVSLTTPYSALLPGNLEAEAAQAPTSNT